jgi:outer membrane protein OmpA-like peptidoglycan-associated protein
MSWLALAFAALLQAAPPAVPAPLPAPQAPATTPVRPRPWPPSGPSTVYFAWGSARVEGEGRNVLDRAAEDYRRNGRVTVEIIAGADESGPNAYNQRLSARRARAVADGLVRRGIPRGVIGLRPMGIRRPLVPTGSGIREPLNRYAEISFPAPVLR